MFQLLIPLPDTLEAKVSELVLLKRLEELPTQTGPLLHTMNSQDYSGNDKFLRSDDTTLRSDTLYQPYMPFRSPKVPHYRYPL
jgi:hypothetical protein